MAKTGKIVAIFGSTIRRNILKVNVTNFQKKNLKSNLRNWAGNAQNSAPNCETPFYKLGSG